MQRCYSGRAESGQRQVCRFRALQVTSIRRRKQTMAFRATGRTGWTGNLRTGFPAQCGRSMRHAVRHRHHGDFHHQIPDCPTSTHGWPAGNNIDEPPYLVFRDLSYTGLEPVKEPYRHHQNWRGTIVWGPCAANWRIRTHLGRNGGINALASDQPSPAIHILHARVQAPIQAGSPIHGRRGSPRTRGLPPQPTATVMGNPGKTGNPEIRAPDEPARPGISFGNLGQTSGLMVAQVK